MSNTIVGWDIGGAHLKAVLLNSNGDVVQVLQLPCQLWRGLAQLELALIDALQALKIKPCNAIHAVTMTGELVDCFANRHEGVLAIASLSVKLLGKETMFYAASSGFVRFQEVNRLTNEIASANWHASASALAMHVGNALFMDIGSTTTDIIAIESGKVKTAAISDAARMRDDSLVYTGVVRTPIMALAQKLPFEGAIVNVAAEYFATMADVYRLTGELKIDDAATADGKGKTALESARRLARMIGHDVETKPMQTWKNLAETCKAVQMQHIKSAALKHLKPNTTIIGAGTGSFLVQQIANDLNCDYLPAYQPISTAFTALIDEGIQADYERCFSAFALACLANKWLAKNPLALLNQYA